ISQHCRLAYCGAAISSRPKTPPSLWWLSSIVPLQVSTSPTKIPSAGRSIMQIVGLVDDIKEGPLEGATWPALYVPVNQNPVTWPALLVRTSQTEAPPF